MQPDVFADAVIVMVKNALGPVLERLAASEARMLTAESRLATIDALRDRLVTVETKAAQPVVLPALEPPTPIDLSPIMERMSAAEARIVALGDVRDRLMTVETKAAQPVVLPAVEIPAPIDLSPVLERVAAAEARLDTLGDLRDRIVVMETKSAVPIAVVSQDLPAPVDVSPILERLAASEARLDVLGDLRDRIVVVETKSAQPTPVVDLSDVRSQIAGLEADLRVVSTRPVPEKDMAPVFEKVDAIVTDISVLRERVAVAEIRQFIPGPMGRDGQPGRDGKDGTNGTDGLGWDDLAVEQADERTFTIKCLRGLQVKELGTLTFPVQIYRGVYVDGKTYERGDGVTYGGSEWHCNETTAIKPGDGSKGWTLKVKRGRDGKDGRDAVTVPVVRAGH